MHIADMDIDIAEQTDETTPDTDPDDYLTEDERADIEAQEEALDAEEEARETSLLARGCLEVAAGFAILAALVLILDLGFGVCFFYELPQFCLPMTLAAGSLLALTTGLFASYRKAFAAFVLIATVWFLVATYVVTNYQFPEVIPTTLPEVGEEVVLTQITTPINANLCVDDVKIGGILSMRFKVPVHPKYVPLRYQVTLTWNENMNRVDLQYNEQLWATYDPARKHWADALHSEREEEETTEATTEPHYSKTKHSAKK